MRAKTSSASRKFGTTLGCAKLATSTTGMPRSVRRSQSHTFSSVGIHFGRLCSPSRGATSTTSIFSGMCMGRMLSGSGRHAPVGDNLLVIDPGADLRAEALVMLRGKVRLECRLVVVDLVQEDLR